MGWSNSVEPSYTHESKTQSVEPSHTHEPSKPAYKEFHVPQATTKDNSQHGTNAMRKTTPKTAKTTGTTTTTPTYRRKRRSVRYVKSRPMYKQPHKYRSVRSVPSRPMYKQSYNRVVFFAAARCHFKAPKQRCLSVHKRWPSFSLTFRALI